MVNMCTLWSVVGLVKQGKKTKCGQNRKRKTDI